MADDTAALPIAPDEFARLVRDYAQRLRDEPGFARLVGVLCGTPERAEAFGRPGGVGISAFAAMLGLPASTVRHYLRLGLITPYAVNGKFRFWFHNVVQAESVRQWRDLGLSLDEIRDQRGGERVGGQIATFNAAWSGPTTVGLSALVTDKTLLVGPSDALGRGAPPNANRTDLATAWTAPLDPRPPQPAGAMFRDRPAADAWPQALARARLEVRAARERLEERRRQVEAQWERARALEQALGVAAETS